MIFLGFRKIGGRLPQQKPFYGVHRLVKPLLAPNQNQCPSSLGFPARAHHPLSEQQNSSLSHDPASETEWQIIKHSPKHVAKPILFLPIQKARSPRTRNLIYVNFLSPKELLLRHFSLSIFSLHFTHLFKTVMKSIITGNLHTT